MFLENPTPPNLSPNAPAPPDVPRPVVFGAGLPIASRHRRRHQMGQRGALWAKTYLYQPYPCPNGCPMPTTPQEDGRMGCPIHAEVLGEFNYHLEGI